MLRSHGFPKLLPFRSHGFPKLLPFSSFIHVFHLSTSVTENPSPKFHFMVDYLVNSLGFSKEQAISTSQKLTHMKSTERPDSVLNLFKETGLDDTQIRSIVSSYPRLLCSNAEKTLKPKIRVFQDLGSSGAALGEMFARLPCILTLGLNLQIIPCIKILRTVLSSDENVIPAIKKKGRLLSSNFSKNVLVNVLLLQNRGFPSNGIEKLILRNPNIFIKEPNKLEEIVKRAEVEFGIPCKSVKFNHAIEVLSAQTRLTLESKLLIFKSFGWSELEIVTMFQNNPLCLKISEANIKNKLNFYMKELEYNPQYIVSRPALLSYSMEKRIVPRHNVLRVLKEKRLIKTNLDLYSVLALTEIRFSKMYILKYKDEIPDVCKTYINVVGAGAEK